MGAHRDQVFAPTLYPPSAKPRPWQVPNKRVGNPYELAVLRDTALQHSNKSSRITRDVSDTAIETEFTFVPSFKRYERFYQAPGIKQRAIWVDFTFSCVSRSSRMRFSSVNIDIREESCWISPCKIGGRVGMPKSPLWKLRRKRVRINASPIYRIRCFEFPPGREGVLHFFECTPPPGGTGSTRGILSFFQHYWGEIYTGVKAKTHANTHCCSDSAWTAIHCLMDTLP